MSQYTDNDPRLVVDALNGELDELHQLVQHSVGMGEVSESQVQLLRGLVSLAQYTLQESAQQQYFQAELSENLQAVYQELEYVKTSNAAYEKHLQWLKDQIVLSRKAVGKLKRRSIMRQTLETAIDITFSETGSIFLLGREHVIVDYILLRQQATQEERRDLIGDVLKRGLAGWVVKNMQVALVNNTTNDKRWLNLPDQPYRVGSALCVPLVRGSELVGVMTLTHSEIEHYTPQDCELVETAAHQTAILLENDRLEARSQQLIYQNQIHEEYFRQLLSSPFVGAFMFQGNKFVQVNDRCASLFGYPRDELMRLPSIASLIAYEDRASVNQILQTCLAGNPPNLNHTFHISRKNGQVAKVMVQGLMTQF
ncbi:MAG: GAF domain-containing protein, partial [Cyanobacteria bacterium P01_H01_bin.121]